MRKIVDIEEQITKKLEENNIQGFSSTLGIPETIPMIMLDTLNQYVYLAKTLEIKNIFYSLRYYDEYNFEVDDSTIIKEYGKEVYEIIKDEIEEYRNKITDLDFDIPSGVLLYFPKDGVSYTLTIENDWISDLGLYDVKTMLEDIIENNSENIKARIEEQRHKEKEEIEKLKLQLEEELIDKEDFICLSNMKLRQAYARKLAKDDDFIKKYGKCFKYPSGKVNPLEVTDFIEILWKKRWRRNL